MGEEGTRIGKTCSRNPKDIQAILWFIRNNPR